MPFYCIIDYIYRRLNSRPVKRSCFSGLVAGVEHLGASGFKTSCERLLLSKLSPWGGIHTRTDTSASIFINMTFFICIIVFCLSVFLMEAQGTYGPYARNQNQNQLYPHRQISHLSPMPGHGNSINFGGNRFIIVICHFFYNNNNNYY